VPALDKDQPSAADIAALRARFVCEAEIDRILTRKMQLRAGPGYTTQTLAGLIDGTARLIRAHIGTDFSISDARWLTGGASKLQMAFTLHWCPAGSARQHTAMVLRMQPAESLVESSRRREFEVLAAMQGVVPVPTVYWHDADAMYLPYPAIVYEFVPGVTKPQDATSQASGMATRMAARWRDSLGPQFVSCIARVHKHPLDHAALPSFDMPAAGTASIELALNHWERVWEEDADEDIPLIRLAAAWLRRHQPVCAKPVLLHGDYRMGNFLFTEHDARITAILDWEMARVGDHHFDIAWAMHPAYGTYDADGKTLLVGGLLPESEFCAHYEQESGFTIDPETLHYYKIYCGWLQGVIAIATAWRIAHNRKTHQDVQAAWIIGIGPKLLAELRDLMAQAV
jgi:aminoglycoside phosphotransferase (APT) family kinase protein